jgi:hypothetical protein
MAAMTSWPSVPGTTATSVTCWSYGGLSSAPAGASTGDHVPLEAAKRNSPLLVAA